jgi:hypothetical protein
MSASSNDNRQRRVEEQVTRTTTRSISIERETLKGISRPGDLSLEQFLTLRSSREDEKAVLVAINRRFAAVVEENAQLAKKNEKLEHEVNYRNRLLFYRVN